MPFEHTMPSQRPRGCDESSGAPVPSSLPSQCHRDGFVVATQAPDLPKYLHISDPEQHSRIMLLPQARVTGFALLDENNQMLSQEGYPVKVNPCERIQTAFTTEHNHDAHFTLYNVMPNGGMTINNLSPQCPRLTKSGIHLLTAEDGGLGIIQSTNQVVGTVIALDYDLPQHTEWNDGLRAQCAEMFAAAAEKSELFAKPTLFYTTRGGARFVWFMAVGMPVEGQRGLEDLLGGVICEAYIAGIPVDPACKDWTRLMRFNRVVRDNQRTSAQTYYRESWGRPDLTAREEGPGPEGPLFWHPSRIRPVSIYVPGDFTTTPMARRFYEDWRHIIGKVPNSYRGRLSNIDIGTTPHDDHCRTILYTDGDRGQMTEDHKWIRNQLKSKAGLKKPVLSASFAYGILAENKRLVDANGEGLHQGILRLARSICIALNEQVSMSGKVNPQMLYALVIEPARRDNNARESGRRSEGELSNEVWRACAHVFRQTAGAAEQQRDDEEELGRLEQQKARNELEQMDATRDLILRYFREQMPNVEEDWLQAHWSKLLILSIQKVGRCTLTIGRDGTVRYSDPASAFADLLTTIRDCGHPFLKYMMPGKDPEEMRILTENEVMIGNSTMVKKQGVQFTRYSYQGHIIARGKGEHLQVGVKLPLPGPYFGYKPVFDPQVDEWLRYLGANYQESFLDWLAAFTEIEHPSAALYLQGRSGIGKGMLMEGLMNLVSSQKFAPFTQLLENHHDSAMDTFFLLADEDTTISQYSQKSLSGTFRRVVSEKSCTLNPKGFPHAQVTGYWRVLLTANNDRMLVLNEDVSEEDLEAVIVRILHILCDNDGAINFLKSIGNRSGTEGWPDKQIPQHIMWLRQERLAKLKEKAANEGRRFLVEGIRAEYHEGLAYNTNGADICIQGIARLLHNKNSMQGIIKIHEKSEEVRINISAFSRWLLQAAKSGAIEKMVPRKFVSRALKSLSLGERFDRFEGKKNTRCEALNVTALIRQLNRMQDDWDLSEALGHHLWHKYCPPDLIEAVRKFEEELQTEETNGYHTNGAHSINRDLIPPHIPPEPSPSVISKHMQRVHRPDIPEDGPIFN